MKKTTIYISVLSAIFIALLLITGFTWYGKEADDIAQGEKLLEQIASTDVEYKGEIRGIEAYNYADENKSYIVSTEDGSILGYISSGAYNHGDDEIVKYDDSQLIEITMIEIETLFPEFYEFKVKYTINELSGGEYIVYAKQYTEDDNYTGNLVNIRITQYGTIASIQIHNREDQSVADGIPAISEDEAIEIAYEASKVRMEELAQEIIYNEQNGREKPEDDEPVYNDLGELVEETEEVELPPLEVYLDDRDEHEVIVNRSVHEGSQIYIIEILNVENNIMDMDMNDDKMTMQLIVTIDANTGEVISAGYGA